MTEQLNTTTQRTIDAGSAPEAGRPSERPALVSSWRMRLAALAALAVAIRLGLWTIGLAVTGYAVRASPLTLLVWSRWDAPHYLRVATIGYVARGPDALWIVFFPLYPLLVHGAAWLIGNVIASALVVSLVAAVVAAWFLYKLVELDVGSDVAWRAAVLLFAFPTAYFLAAPYSEGVFLASVLASMYGARTERWGLATVAGMAATMSRLTGLALVPALAFEAMRSSGRTRVQRLLCVALVPLGFVAYLGLNQAVLGSPLRFMKIERGRPWYQKAVPPWHPLIEAVRVLTKHASAWAQWSYYPSRVAAFLLAAAVLIWGWRRLRSSDHAFAWTALAMSLSGARLISLPRYILGLFPVFLVLAYKLHRRWVFWGVVASSLAAQGFLFARYARALWAF